MKTNISIVIILLVKMTWAYGQSFQDTSKVHNDSTVVSHIDPEQGPNFQGGNKAMIDFIRKNLKWPSPEWCGQGTVYVQFTVDTSGTIKDGKIIRGLCDKCDKEALRLISIMPKWTPRKMFGKPVDGQFMLPIKFKME